jgi:small conductance mechanosensitive channel
MILAVTLLIFLAFRILSTRINIYYISKYGDGTERRKRAETLAGIVRSLGFVFIIVTTLLLLLSEMGVDLKPLLAAAGIGGIAIGFGAQSLVKDFLAGFFILFENQIRVNDVVEIGSSAGLVEHVGMRTLTLRDFSGIVHILPNGSIDRVKNFTKDYSRYVFDIGVAYKEDIDQVMGEIKGVGQSLQKDPDFAPLIVEPLEVFGLDRFDDSAMIVKARITTQPLQQWTIAREFNRRLKKAFDQAGIEIPFPHRTVYMGKNQQEQKQVPFPVESSTDLSGRER